MSDPNRANWLFFGYSTMGKKAVGFGEIMTDLEIRDVINKQKAERKSIETQQVVAPTGIVSLESSPEPATPISTAQTPAPAIATPDIDLLIKQKIDVVVDQYKAKIDSVTTELEIVKRELSTATQQIQSTTMELEKSKSEQQRLEDLFKLRGNGNPSVNYNRFGNDDKASGAYAESLQLLRDAAAYDVSTSAGSLVRVRDTRELDQYIRDNKREIMRDLEAAMKRAGFLRGSRSSVQVETNAPTVKADVPEGFLDVLSSLMRQEHFPAYIWWQFATTRIEFGKGQGDTIKIPRAPFTVGSSSVSDYLLSGSGTYADIDQTNTQSVTESAISAVLQEYGLGKSGVSANYPIALPTFVNAYSMLDLMSVLNRNLRYNYTYFEDLAIYSLATGTTRVVYNDNNAVTTTVTDIGTAGDKGVLTETFMNNLFAYARVLQIPTLPDGKYAFVGNTYSIAQLKNDLAGRNQYIDRGGVTDITNILQGMTGNLFERLDGYLGSICGFHIFETNSFGVGANGTPGANNVTLGGSLGTALARDNFIVGVDSIGRGIGVPMEIRPSEITNFNRRQSYVWLSHESFTGMDIDPSRSGGSASERLRVIKVRSLSVAV
jgi:hypothetical protein